MIGWIILGILLLFFAVVLFTPAGIRASYDRGEVKAAVRFGPVQVPVYPREKKEKPPKEKKEQKKEEASEAPQGEKPQKKVSLNEDQILYSLEKLPPILGRALKRVGRSLRFDPLQVHLLVAGTDPAKTAILYGRLEGALAAGLPTLHRLVRIKNQDIQLFLDFQEESMDCIADVGVSLRLWDVLVMALCAGCSALKWYLGFRKLADKPGEETNEQTEPASEAGAA